MAQRSLPKRLWYGFLHVLCRLLGVAVLAIRCVGRGNVPAEGGLLVLCNHQSHLDPILVGLTLDRRLNFLARDSLFRFAPFRWLIQSLDAIPIDREGTGLSGLKETLRRLKHDEAVVVFPEGTRTCDGQVAPLKPGFLAVARRSGAPMLPVAIDGAFRAWPRWRRFPLPARVCVVVGRPVLAAEIASMDDPALLAEIQRRIGACHQRARQMVGGQRGDAALSPKRGGKKACLACEASEALL